MISFSYLGVIDSGNGLCIRSQLRYPNDYDYMTMGEREHETVLPDVTRSI